MTLACRDVALGGVAHKGSNAVLVQELQRWLDGLPILA